MVELPAAKRVQQAHITIGDVSVLRGGDDPLRQRIAALDLAAFDAAESSLAISREQISFRIQLAGIDGRLFRVEGAARVQVQRVRQAVSEEEVTAAARKALLQRAPVAAGGRQPTPGATLSLAAACRQRERRNSHRGRVGAVQ